MIKSFASDDTERIWNGDRIRGFPFEIRNAARRKLRMLNNATQLLELKVPPNNRLEKRRGGRKGQFSIRVNGQWRVCFHWQRGDAYEVEIVDYH